MKDKGENKSHIYENIHVNAMGAHSHKNKKFQFHSKESKTSFFPFASCVDASCMILDVE
jgi:hypothetical protein